MTHKIIITEGCTAGGISFDGIREENLTEEQRLFWIDYLLEKAHLAIGRREFQLRNLVELFQYDEYISDSEPCEQCGDTVSETIYNI